MSGVRTWMMLVGRKIALVRSRGGHKDEIFARVKNPPWTVSANRTRLPMQKKQSNWNLIKIDVNGVKLIVQNNAFENFQSACGISVKCNSYFLDISV